MSRHASAHTFPRIIDDKEPIKFGPWRGSRLATGYYGAILAF